MAYYELQYGTWHDATADETHTPADGPVEMDDATAGFLGAQVEQVPAPDGDENGDEGADTEPPDDPDDLEALDGVGPRTATRLAEAGYGSFRAIRQASAADLASVDNVSAADAEGFHAQLRSE